MSIFQTTLAGYVAVDPTAQPVGQSQVVKFSVAHKIKWTDSATGELKEKTTWVNCQAWNQLGQLILDNVRRGYGITVLGTVDARAYMGQDGEAKASLNLTISEILWIQTAPKDSRDSYEDVPF